MGFQSLWFVLFLSGVIVTHAFVTVPSIVLRQTKTRPTTPLYASSSSSSFDFALLFDCDGVILETEELHRVAYNAAFEEFQLKIDGQPVEWSVEYYDMLQNTVGGGKPKMKFHFTNTTAGVWPTVGADATAPSSTDERTALIDALQTFKTAKYKELLEKQAVPRPGVLDLLDQALDDHQIAVGVCSASTKEAAQRTLALTLGSERVARLDVCLLGDDVAAKKPNPLIYTTAAQRIQVPPQRCIVVEDSLIGLQAAVAAGMNCIITYTEGTAAVDFYAHGAAAKMPDLATAGVTLEKLFAPLRTQGLDAELLVDVRDPVVSSSAAVSS